MSKSDAGARANHCPFLNRRDARCGEHMSLQGLGHAFDYCFGRYQGCPVYFQMLIERRTRRGETVTLPQNANAVVQLTIHRDAFRLAKTQTAAASAPAHANAA